MNALTPEELASRLQNAAQNRTPTSPADVEGLTLDMAYATSEAGRVLALERGERVVGYKIALSNAPAQQFFGASEPVFGYLFDSFVVPSGATVNTAGLDTPAVEIEVAFTLGSALTSSETTAHDVIAATKSIAPALEIVGSRWQGGAQNVAMLVADNASVAGVVLGESKPPTGGLSHVTSTLEVGERSAEGSGANVLGDPCEAVAWLARHLARAGRPLQAGQIIMSGTLSTYVLVDGARTASAEVAGIGSVSVNFA